MSSKPVSLVIPGRNCQVTIGQCLTAVVPLLQGPHLGEIIFVDDGSTDETPNIVAKFPVKLISGPGRGPGAARNLGWQAAQHPLVWFVDSDCVSEPDALDILIPHLDDAAVGGVSGSYGIMNPESTLACLIHEEIIQRHRTMGRQVDFLATFNVLYRREALEKVSGFDERFLKAQDAELSFRITATGYKLHFAFDSRVKHFHERRWLRYLSTQRAQGYWRVWLHLSHSGHSTGDSYSSLIDHLQPPLAMLTLALLPLALVSTILAWIPVVSVALLILAQIPLTASLMRRLARPKYLLFPLMSFVRAFWRGIGMTHGVLVYQSRRLGTRSAPVEEKP